MNNEFLHCFPLSRIVGPERKGIRYIPKASIKRNQSSPKSVNRKVWHLYFKNGHLFGVRIALKDESLDFRLSVFLKKGHSYDEITRRSPYFAFSQETVRNGLNALGCHWKQGSAEGEFLCEGEWRLIKKWNEYCASLVIRFVKIALNYDESPYFFYCGFFMNNRYCDQSIHTTNSIQYCMISYDGITTERVSTGTYIGAFSKGFLNGLAVIHNKTQSFLGYVKNGAPCGLGSAINTTGLIQSGIYEKGKKDGMNVITYSDGTSYQGYYKEGKRYGIGVDMNRVVIEDIIDPTTRSSGYLIGRSTFYFGVMNSGIPNGRGNCIDFSDRSTYRGYWKNGRYDGYGEYLKLQHGFKIQGWFNSGVYDWSKQGSDQGSKGKSNQGSNQGSNNGSTVP